jgi:hypothetical protein
MSDQAHNANEPLTQNAWGAAVQLVFCAHCDWQYLLPAGSQLPRCPHCFQSNLAPVEQAENSSGQPDYCPELVLPYTAAPQAIDSAIRQFAEGIPYAPQGLDYATLRARLYPVYLPMWLVDANIDATWQAEAGFNYQVVSHQEQFDQNRGGWHTREVTETRTRWEPRIGRLQRAYQNVPAPALEEAKAIRSNLGDFDLSRPAAYHPSQLEHVSVRLPDRAQQDAWSEAAAAFQQIGSSEVKEACASDHLRQFRWTATFTNRNWTLLLLPAYSTYYLDDENRPQPVMLHGQTGRVTGSRRSSMARAQRASLIYLSIGLTIFLLGLIMGGLSVMFPPLAPLAILAVVIGLPCSLAAIVPVTIAWNFNRQQNPLK